MRYKDIQKKYTRYGGLWKEGNNLFEVGEQMQYEWDSSKNGFVKTDTPVLTKNFAGIGTREINAKGVQAIKDVYKKTQEFIDSKSVNTSSTAPQTEPTEAVTNKPTKGTTQAVEAPVSQNNDDSNAAKASINTFKEFTWARYSPNSYEVSTKGDKRFSALNARLKDGRTIEEAYQLDVKGYRQDVNGVQDTNWRKGKGKPPINGLS